MSFAILRLLADGAFHSGETVGRAVGSSRANVWHGIHELEAQGVCIFKVRGRGYRLADPIDLLDANAVRAALAHRGARLEVEVLDQCPSTNVLALERAASGAPNGTAIACELQTAGRGRRGSRWVTPLGGGLALSLLWRFQQGASALAGLSLAAGVACVRALESLGARGVALKWPNDIVHGTAKVGGILIELQGDYLGPSAVVVGIGLNTRLSAVAKQQIDQPVTDLAHLIEVLPPRNEVLAGVLAELAAVMSTFARYGFAAFRDEWLAHHAHQGERVRLVMADTRAVEGRALGVAEDGALLLERPGGVERFHSGEISLRRAA